MILFVSGCGGFSPPNYADRADRLVRSGYVVAYVDYLRARDIEDACEGSGESISVQEIGEYVVAAATELEQEPYVDGNRVFAVGWSLGGGGVLSALNLIDPASSPLTAVAGLYPACRGVRPWQAALPALLLLGEFDNIQPPEFCRALVQDVKLAAVHVRTYSRAHHAFDAIELPVITEPRKGPTVGYNPQAAAEAWEMILKFFNEGRRLTGAAPVGAAGTPR
jgi:dienelactone hydrolase